MTQLGVISFRLFYIVILQAYLSVHTVVSLSPSIFDFISSYYRLSKSYLMFHFLSCLDARNHFLSVSLLLWLPFHPVLHKLLWPFQSINLIVSSLPRTLNRLLITLRKNKTNPINMAQRHCFIWFLVASLTFLHSSPSWFCSINPIHSDFFAIPMWEKVLLWIMSVEAVSPTRLKGKKRTKLFLSSA